MICDFCVSNFSIWGFVLLSSFYQTIESFFVLHSVDHCAFANCEPNDWILASSWSILSKYESFWLISYKITPKSSFFESLLLQYSPNNLFCSFNYFYLTFYSISKFFTLFVNDFVSYLYFSNFFSAFYEVLLKVDRSFLRTSKSKSIKAYFLSLRISYWSYFLILNSSFCN